MQVEKFGEELGWSEFFAHSYMPYAEKGYQVGRVAVAHRDQYQLYTEKGDRTAVLTGKFRHQIEKSEEFPVVGDWVVVHSLTETDQVLIEAVLPRRGQFSRQAAGTPQDIQVVAANVDTLFLVSGLDHDFNLRRIERYLVMAWQSGATPVVVLNKTDLCDELEEKIAAVEEIAIAVPIIALSALQQSNLDALQPYLQPGKTIALLGSSGVGKSTLTNQLMGEAIQATQSVRADDSRGRHTTTHREMLRLPSGALLIDTPGMRELQISSTADSVEETFSDIESLAEQCRFRDCQHQSEPGCAIQAAIEEGTLSAKRLSSYQKLQREQAYQNRRQDKQSQSNAKARWKKITKAIRQKQQN
ncbi:MAG: ribosome small subunit-dependent GTPase A [Cyanobacteria bacterium J06634_6]